MNHLHETRMNGSGHWAMTHEGKVIVVVVVDTVGRNLASISETNADREI